MDFKIERVQDVSMPLGEPFVIRFSGSIPARELFDLKFDNLERMMLDGCKSSADYLLALEIIFRRHEQSQNKS